MVSGRPNVVVRHHSSRSLRAKPIAQKAKPCISHRTGGLFPPNGTVIIGSIQKHKPCVAQRKGTFWNNQSCVQRSNTSPRTALVQSDFRIPQLLMFVLTRAGIKIECDEHSTEVSKT